MQHVIKECKWLFEQFDIAKAKPEKTHVLIAIENKAMIYAAINFKDFEGQLGLKYNEKDARLYL